MRLPAADTRKTHLKKTDDNMPICNTKKYEDALYSEKLSEITCSKCLRTFTKIVITEYRKNIEIRND